jgi:hypothetical protein
VTAPVSVGLFDHPNYPRRACRGADPDQFCQLDGERWDHAKKRMRVTARRYCSRCPVLAACRRAGEGKEIGLWGGVAYSNHGYGERHVDLLRERR